MNSKRNIIVACMLAIVLSAVYCVLRQGWQLPFTWPALLLGGAVGLLFNRLAAHGAAESGFAWKSGLCAATIVGGALAYDELARWREPPASSTLAARAEATPADRDALVSIATDLAQQKIDAGQTLPWPPGMVLEYAAGKDDFPPEIWIAAEKKWNAMPAEQQAELKALRERLLKATILAAEPTSPQRIGQKIAFAALALLLSFVPASRLILLPL